jgi:hypothetical protein
MHYNNTNQKSHTETHLSIVLTMNDAILRELEAAQLAGSEKWVMGNVSGVSVRVYTPDAVQAGKQVFLKLQTHYSPFGHESKRLVLCLNGSLADSEYLENLDVEAVAQQIADFFSICDGGRERVLKLLRGEDEADESEPDDGRISERR